jgi:hypothetical protein
MATITEARKALENHYRRMEFHYKSICEIMDSLMETDNGRLKDTAPKSKKKEYEEIANAIAKNALRKAS